MNHDLKVALHTIKNAERLQTFGIFSFKVPPQYFANFDPIFSNILFQYAFTSSRC